MLKVEQGFQSGMHLKATCTTCKKVWRVHRPTEVEGEEKNSHGLVYGIQNGDVGFQVFAGIAGLRRG